MESERVKVIEAESRLVAARFVKQGERGTKF